MSRLDSGHKGYLLGKRKEQKRRVIIPIQRNDDQTANRQTGKTTTITSLLTYPPFRIEAYLGKRGKC